MLLSKVGRPKSKEKREAILNAAIRLFLAKGVRRTSMEAVAKSSGVSKQTIYSHYKSKDALFSATIQFKCKEYMVTQEHLNEQDVSIETALTQIAGKFLALFHDEGVISMYATIISEARNTPHLAKLFYEAGPLASIDAMSAALSQMTNNRLSREHVRMLAVDFYSFLKGDLHIKSLMNLEFKLNKDEQQEYVKSVVSKTLCLLEHHYVVSSKHKVSTR